MADKPQTTKSKKSKHVEVFVNETDHECTMIKVTGPNHEKVATDIVRRFHGSKF